MKKKTLVAYFSASGKTEFAAKKLAGKLNADLYEIKPEIPYTHADLNWNNKQSRSSLEMNDPSSRPEFIRSELDISPYDEILIGFPVWWYVAPTIINTFLEAYDFNGKTVRAFATSGGSGIQNCEANLQKQYPLVNWAAGMLLNSDPAIDVFAASLTKE